MVALHELAHEEDPPDAALAEDVAEHRVSLAEWLVYLEDEDENEEGSRAAARRAQQEREGTAPRDLCCPITQDLMRVPYVMNHPTRPLSSS